MTPLHLTKEISITLTSTYMYTEYDRRPHLVEEREAILFTVEVKQLPHVDVCVVLDTKLGDVKYVTCNT